MRVAHVITRLIIGGAQENTLSSVLGLHAKPGLEVSLLSGPTTGSEGSLEPQAARIPGLLTLIPELIRPVRPWQDFLAWQKLTRPASVRQLLDDHAGVESSALTQAFAQWRSGESIHANPSMEGV